MSDDEFATIANELDSKVAELQAALTGLKSRVKEEMKRKSRLSLVDDILNERIVTHDQFTNDPVMRGLKSVANRVESDLKRIAVGKSLTRLPAMSVMNTSIYTDLLKEYNEMNSSETPLKRKLLEISLNHYIDENLKLDLEPKRFTTILKRVLITTDSHKFHDTKQRTINLGNEYITSALSQESNISSDDMWWNLHELIKVCGDTVYVTHLQAALDRSMAHGEFVVSAEHHENSHDPGNHNFDMAGLLQAKIDKNGSDLNNIGKHYRKCLRKVHYDITGFKDDDNYVEGIVWVHGESSANMWNHMMDRAFKMNLVSFDRNTHLDWCQVMENALAKGIHPGSSYPKILERVRTRIQEYEGLIRLGEISRQKARSDGLACWRELEQSLMRSPKPVIGGRAKRIKRK